MLTRNKRKRNASRDKSCPKNSNQQYSTILCKDVVEVEEMVTMDHGRTSGGLDDDGERMDYLQVAWLLREKLNDLVDGDKGEFPGLGLRSLLDMAVSHNIVSLDPKMLNPVLWRTLPKELLHLVLARLPVPDIIGLRCLSREWRKDMATVNSEINQACDEANPTMLALLSRKDDGHSVTIYDISKCRWEYAYRLHLRRPWNDDQQGWPCTWTAVDACDGGLVCFISLWKPTKRNRLCIVVVNLLTRVQHELPPLHYVYFALPAMVQIKVDFHTKCYQVVVAGYRRGGLTIEIYDSSTRQWTRATPQSGCIFGLVYKWTYRKDWYYRSLSTTLGAYDFAEGKLELYSEDNPSEGKTVIDWVLKTDRMFVLQKQTQMDVSPRGRIHQVFSITEYHFENQTKAWVQEKSYKCPSFEDSILSLSACDGFLMVHHSWRNQYLWLLDLSTSEWSHILKISEDLEDMSKSLMCKAYWNFIP